MKQATQLWVVFVLIIAAAAARLLPLPPNFTPILAIAFFAGSRISKTWVAYAIPFVALLASDLVIGFYPGMAMIYIPFLIMVALGMKASARRVSGHLALGTLGAVIFFLLSNFGVWLATPMYPKTWDGLIQCYTMGIPFFRNTLLSLGFFGSFLFAAEYCFRRLRERAALQAR